MGRITEYSAVTSSRGKSALSSDDVFILDGTNGSRKITANELAEALRNLGTIGSKNGIYRGANLGSGATFAAASTDDQRTAISNGTFSGLFIGDYWTVNSVVYRIADFNYWKRIGDTDFNTNHVVLVPDANMGTDVMNSTNDTTGAYVGSYMYSDSTSKLGEARTKIANDFGGYLATHKIYLSNAVTNGAESAGAWYDSTVDLMSEIMVYGCNIRKAVNGTSYLNTSEKSQLALFRLDPQMVNRRSSYWLRDVVSATNFADVSANGNATVTSASSSLGVRPAFIVKGTTS